MTTTSDSTRDLNMLQNAYKQNLKPISNTRTFDPKKKVQPQKPTINKSAPIPQSKRSSTEILSTDIFQ